MSTLRAARGAQDFSQGTDQNRTRAHSYADLSPSRIDLCAHTQRRLRCVTHARGSDLPGGNGCRGSVAAGQPLGFLAGCGNWHRSGVKAQLNLPTLSAQLESCPGYKTHPDSNSFASGSFAIPNSLFPSLMKSPMHSSASMDYTSESNV